MSFKFLTHQLLTVVYRSTVVVTGNGGLGFDPEDGALEMAPTPTGSSRRENYPLSNEEIVTIHIDAGLCFCDQNGGVLNRRQKAIGGQLWCQQPR